MGLLIKQAENKNIKIQGTEIELPSVYGRIEFAGRADGTTLEVNISTYASKQAFKDGASVLSTSVEQGNFTVKLQQGEAQSVEIAHKYAKYAMDKFGYQVDIV